jgi:hypothetical protein
VGFARCKVVVVLHEQIFDLDSVEQRFHRDLLREHRRGQRPLQGGHACDRHVKEATTVRAREGRVRHRVSSYE